MLCTHAESSVFAVGFAVASENSKNSVSFNIVHVWKGIIVTGIVRTLLTRIVDTVLGILLPRLFSLFEVFRRLWLQLSLISQHCVISSDGIFKIAFFKKPSMAA